MRCTVQRCALATVVSTRIKDLSEKEEEEKARASYESELEQFIGENGFHRKSADELRSCERKVQKNIMCCSFAKASRISTSV